MEVHMVVNIVPIGNSKGIRIPKAILEQCEIEDQLKLQIDDGKIILEPVRSHPRTGWDEAFQAMAANNDDNLLVEDGLDLDWNEWEW